MLRRSEEVIGNCYFPSSRSVCERERKKGMNSCLVRVMYIEACIYLVDGGMPHAWVAT